jgi:hypothetical protein
MSSDYFYSVVHSLIWEVKSGNKLISIGTGYLRTWDAGEGSAQVRGSIPLVVIWLLYSCFMPEMPEREGGAPIRVLIPVHVFFLIPVRLSIGKSFFPYSYPHPGPAPQDYGKPGQLGDWLPAYLGCW